MALFIQDGKDTNFGIKATYFKIARNSFDFIKNEPCYAVVYGWKDADARQAYPQDPIFTETLNLTFETDPTRADIYSKIKTLAGWESALDQ